MEFISLHENTYAFTGAVNIGYSVKEGKGLLIDTGLDDSAANKVLRILDEKGLPLDYCIITHAHTDHYGGVDRIRSKRDVKILAPRLEKAIMENPVLEPIYLFNGAFPPISLRNKFLEAKGISVDKEIEAGPLQLGPFQLDILGLPGHSYGQIGVMVEGVLYASDAYFGKEALAKHIVPFITDADQTLATLHYILEQSCHGSIPGHGIYEEDFRKTVEENIALHHRHMKALEELIAGKQSWSFEGIVKEYLNEVGVSSRQLGQLLLYRTSITAYLISLERRERITMVVTQNELVVALHS